MSDPTEVIKRAALDAVAQSKPVQILYGTVLARAPIQIRISQKLVLIKEDLVVTATADQNCTPGDRVALLSLQGGQQYLLLDKVVY